MTVFINMAKRPVEDAIFSISTKKGAPKDWAYLYAKAEDHIQSAPLHEIEKVLRTKFQDVNPEIFVFEDKREIIMIADNKSRQTLPLFSKAIFDRLGGGALNCSANDFADKGMEFVSRVLAKHLPDGDAALRIAHARMGRPSNCILILDDDPMVLKTMEFALKGFGFVGTATDPEAFLVMYREYAPNIVFVDIHLKGYKGTNVVNAVRRQFDPNCHAIMISADAKVETVVSVKEAGAKGYIVKPVNREAVFQAVMKAPTFVPKGITT